MRDCSRNTYRARKAIEKLLSARLKYIYKPPSPLVCLFMSVINKRRPPRGDLNKDFLSFVVLYRVVFSHPNERKNKRHTANRVEELCYAGRYSLRHHFRNVKHRIPKEVGRRNNLRNFSFFFDSVRIATCVCVRSYRRSDKTGTSRKEETDEE